MQTAFHILTLAKELRKTITGARIIGTEFFKKARCAYVHFKGEQRQTLGFSFHPAGPGTFLVPPSKVNLDTREKPWPLFGIEGATVMSVEQRGFDRITVIRLRLDNDERLLAIESMGPSGNIWLLDGGHKKMATLRKREFTVGDPYNPPPPPDRLSPFDLSLEELAASLSGSRAPSLVTYLEKNLLGCNRTLAKEIVKRSDLDFVNPRELDNDSISVLAGEVAALSGLFADRNVGYLYELRSSVEVYPFKLSSVDDQPQKFKTLSLGVLAATMHRISTDAKDDEQKHVTDAVRRAAKRLENKCSNIERDIEDAANFEHYKRVGDLLTANLPSLRRGMKSVEVEDLFADTPEMLTIDLDPALTPNENTESYFKRYRKGREGLELLKRRLEITRQELTQISEISAALDAGFDSARDRFRPEIDSLLPGASARRDSVPRLPYREYTLSTGARIYVGKDGSDNDRTTFEFARPYELWFHAQQCPGSHVVLKSPHKSFEPSKAEIEETAATAAYFSKARKDSMVPVIYAQRKYVRKPRKAKPGLVTVEREKSVMVEPKKPA